MGRYAIRDVIFECKGKERMIESQAGLISLYIFIQGNEGGLDVSLRCPRPKTNARRRNGTEAQRGLGIWKNRNRFVPLIRARSHKMTPTSIEWACLRRAGKETRRRADPPGNYSSPYTFVHRIGTTTDKL